MIRYVYMSLSKVFKIIPGPYAQDDDVLMVDYMNFNTKHSKKNCINVEYYVLDRHYMDLNIKLLSKTAADNLEAVIKAQDNSPIELTDSTKQEIFRVVNHLFLLDIKSKRNKLKEGGDENA